MRARTAILLVIRARARRLVPLVVFLRRFVEMTVIKLRGFTARQSEILRLWRIARQRQSFRGEIVVDLAVGRRVPHVTVADGRGLLSRFVIAQQMADFMN